MALFTRNGNTQKQVSEIPPKFYYCLNSANTQVLTFPNSFDFTANPATDILTALFAFGGFVGNFPEYDIVQLTTTGVLPNPLLLATDYYLLNVSGLDLQLSLTPNGTPIDITNAGAGVHTINATGVRHFKFNPTVNNLSGILIRNNSKIVDLNLILQNNVNTWNSSTYTVSKNDTILTLPICNPEFRISNTTLISNVSYEILIGVE